jgi:hypothetical protein
MIDRKTSNIAGITRADTGQYIAWLSDSSVASLCGIVGSFILSKTDSILDPGSSQYFRFANNYGQIIGEPSSTSQAGSGSAYAGYWSKPFACLHKVLASAVFTDPPDKAYFYLI